MTDLTTETVDALMNSGAYTVEPTQVTGTRGDVERLAFPLPQDYELKTLTLIPAAERFAPLRNHGTVTVRDTASLIAYVAKHRTPWTEFYADATRGTVTAVLNAPGGPDQPAWADHRCVLQLTTSEAWAAWADGSGAYMAQEPFADFFEDQSKAFHDPDAATMLEVAQNFHASTDRQFGSQVKIASGQVQFTHSEVTTERVGDSLTMEVPRSFKLRLTVWESTRELIVPVLFRYRIERGALRLGWKLNQQAEIKRDVFDKLVLDLSDALGHDTGRKVMIPNPIGEGPDVEEDERELAVIFTGPDPEYRNI